MKQGERRTGKGEWKAEEGVRMEDGEMRSVQKQGIVHCEASTCSSANIYVLYLLDSERYTAMIEAL